MRRAACRSLKEAGYTITLDGYVAHDRRVARVKIADIIKAEVHLTVAGGENRNAGRICDGAGSGVCPYQGYFSRNPETMSTHDMPTNRMNYLGMLQEVSRPELELSGEVGEGRGVGVLPPAPRSEFDNLRVESGRCGGGCGQEKTATWGCRRWCADGLASSWLREGGTGNRICSCWGGSR